MIIPRLGRWSHAAGSRWVWERIYWRWTVLSRPWPCIFWPTTDKGYKWTPFCRVTRRSCWGNEDEPQKEVEQG